MPAPWVPDGTDPWGTLLKAYIDDRAMADNPVFTNKITTPAIALPGLTGAQAGGRFVGFTTGLAPAGGLFFAGDTAIGYGLSGGAPYCRMWVCTTGTGVDNGIWQEAGAFGRDVAIQFSRTAIEAEINAIATLSVGEGLTALSTTTSTMLSNNHPIRFAQILDPNHWLVCNNSTTLHNSFSSVDGLHLPLDANSTYHMEAFLDFYGTPTAGVELRMSLITAVPAGANANVAVPTDLPNSTMTWTPNALNFNTAANTQSGSIQKRGINMLNSGFIHGGDRANALSVVANPTGIANTGANAGFVMVRACQKNAEATDLQVLHNSWLKLTKIA